MKKNNEKITTHGRTFTGIVVSDKMHDSVVVEWIRKRSVPKFERFEKAKTRLSAHNNIDAKKGDFVKIKECRPLSKTKHFIVTEIIETKDNFDKLQNSQNSPRELSTKSVKNENNLELSKEKQEAK